MVIDLELNILTRDGAVWKLVGLITRRPQVQILLPLFVKRSRSLERIQRLLFCVIGEFSELPYNTKKRSAGIALRRKWDCVAYATRRRRRILRGRILSLL